VGDNEAQKSRDRCKTRQKLYENRQGNYRGGKAGRRRSQWKPAPPDGGGKSSYEEITYEGYGPGGVAVIAESMTDNRNRTVSEIRNIFSKAGGNMGEAGCVSWMFHKKGYLVVQRAKAEEDRLMTLALDAGAEDMQVEDDNFVITTTLNDFEKVKKALEDAKMPLEVAEVTMIPQTYVKLEGKEAHQMLRLVETLEDNDDVQNVYANFDIPDEIMNAE